MADRTTLQMVRAIANLHYELGHTLMLLAQHLAQEGEAEDAEAANYAISSDDLERIRTIPLDGLEFSTRAYSRLVKSGIHTIGDLLEKSPDDLRNIGHLGTKSLYEIRSVITGMGILWPAARNQPICPRTVGVAKTSATVISLNGAP